MNWIVANIKPIMLVSGTLTFTMIFAALSPQAALKSSFGETLDGPLADLIVRNWGALIALVGAMLVYSAFDPPSRGMALSVAALSKLTFIGLVLSNGQRFLVHQAGLAVVVDSVMVVVFGVYLARTRSRERS
jgi:hypothetical protein